jgi:hypothetical protein
MQHRGAFKTSTELADCIEPYYTFTLSHSSMHDARSADYHNSWQHALLELGAFAGRFKTCGFTWHARTQTLQRVHTHTLMLVQFATNVSSSICGTLSNGVALPSACATKSKHEAAITTHSHNTNCKSMWTAIRSNRYRLCIISHALGASVASPMASKATTMFDHSNNLTIAKVHICRCLCAQRCTNTMEELCSITHWRWPLQHLQAVVVLVPLLPEQPAINGWQRNVLPWLMDVHINVCNYTHVAHELPSAHMQEREACQILCMHWEFVLKAQCQNGRQRLMSIPNVKCL